MIKIKISNGIHWYDVKCKNIKYQISIIKLLKTLKITFVPRDSQWKFPLSTCKKRYLNPSFYRKPFKTFPRVCNLDLQKRLGNRCLERVTTPNGLSKKFRQIMVIWTYLNHISAPSVKTYQKKPDLIWPIIFHQLRFSWNFRRKTLFPG